MGENGRLRVQPLSPAGAGRAGTSDLLIVEVLCLELVLKNGAFVERALPSLCCPGEGGTCLDGQ